MNLSFKGSIIWLRSVNTGLKFPKLVFAGDTDYATAGLASLTSTARTEVVAISLTADEYNAYDESVYERRVNSDLSRKDLRAISLLRVVDTINSPTGIFFKTFLNRYTPPRLFYSDIHDPNGEAKVIREESIEKFLNAGGTLLDRVGGT